MATIVETFIIEETSDLIHDNEQLTRYHELIAELNLTGQTKIVTGEKSPIPFMHLKTSMVSVFETLCPRKVDVAAFDVSPIPVEILDLVSLSVRENYFKKIEIWYDEKSPDPVCVGYCSEFQVYEYSGVPKELNGKFFPTKKEALQAIKEIAPDFNENFSCGWEANIRMYILGKWADVKHSFEELKQMALKRFMTAKTIELRQKLKETQREIDDLESEAFKKFDTGAIDNNPF